jgi:hypothetical protein
MGPKRVKRATRTTTEQLAAGEDLRIRTDVAHVSVSPWLEETFALQVAEFHAGDEAFAGGVERQPRQPTERTWALRAGYLPAV